MSGQLESRHYFRENDTVQHLEGQFGVVRDSFALFAVIVWDDGRTSEVDQFDPAIVVVERAASE